MFSVAALAPKLKPLAAVPNARLELAVPSMSSGWPRYGNILDNGKKYPKGL